MKITIINTTEQKEEHLLHVNDSWLHLIKMV